MATKYRKKFRRIAKYISDYDLQRESPENLKFSENDLLDLNIFGTQPAKKEGRFLGFFSKSGLEYVFKEFGLLKALRKKGFRNIIFSLNTSDPYQQRFSFYYDKIDQSHMLGEIICHIYHLKMDVPTCESLHQNHIRTIYVEWLSLQDPTKKFSEKRPKLPGQNHPGLGLGLQIFELLILMAKRLRSDAMLNIPEHYHNAALYSSEFFYMNPVYEGLLQAMMRDLSRKWPLAHISTAVDEGCVINIDTGEPLKWFIGRQLTPLNSELMDYFSSDQYRSIYEETIKSNHFKIDESCFQKNVIS